MTNPANTPTDGAAAAGTAGGGAAGDFVDFYQLLDAPTDATTTALRRRINDLYAEAQSNRDHRNVNKRRHYEALCELLPYCRIVLLDADKRARYDRYMIEAKSGTAGIPDFESMMEEIAGRVGDVAGDSTEKVGLLGVEGDDDYLPLVPPGADQASDATHTTDTANRTTNTASASGTGAADSVTLAGRGGQKRRMTRAALASLVGSALSVMVFAGVAVLTRAVRGDMIEAILVAAIAGLVTWLVTHLRPFTVRTDNDRIAS